MAKANSLLRLNGQQINGNNLSCTSEQLHKIIDTLITFVTDCVWYSADIDTFSVSLPELNKTGVPSYIGNSIKLVELSVKVPQFLSGVFLAVPKQVSSVSWSRAYRTEDLPFEEIDQALYEIRAFDTSYFEIFSNNSSLLQPLVTTFGGNLEHQSK